MSKKRLLKLTWIDREGTPYCTQILSPRTARDVLTREPWARLTFPGTSPYLDSYPFHHLTYAAVSRAPRCPVVKLNDGREVVIDVAEESRR